ncbi:MAG TPA: fibronectin type III domain-containing protein, partial [Micromonosporaceae bacterium]|nr:fibronectin type III domain-containing protein [Micromonosporaceae bacterium]
NPNSGDTGGIALDDWYSINQQKYNILQPHLVPPVPSGTPPTTTTTSAPPQVPGTPGTLSCTVTSATSVSLSWGASSGTVTNYQIERATGATSDNFSQVGTSTSTSFNNTGLTTGTTYRYRVRAVNSAGASGYSNIVNCTPQTSLQPPGTPGTLTASGTTSSSTNLSWGASSGTVTNYEIERCTGTDCTSFSQVGTSTTTSFTNTGLSPATTYRYRVRATNAAGSSSYSNIVTVTTSPVTTTTTTTSSPPGTCTATYQQVNSWDTGFQGEVTVTNTGTATASSWTAVVTFPNGQRITQIWGGTTNLSGNSPYTVTPESWNATLAPSGSAVFGFLGSHSGTNNPPTVTCTTTP